MHWKKLKRVIILTKQTNLLYIIFSDSILRMTRNIDSAV